MLPERGMCVRLSVCRKQVLYRNNWTDRNGFLAWILSSIYPTLCSEEIQVSPKQRYFPLGLCPKLWTSNILPRQLDHIVRKTGRRSSLLNSLTTVASLCRLDDRYYTLIAHIAGLSSRMVSAPDCGVRGPRFESRRWQLCLSRQLLRYTVCAPFLQCLGRLSLPPFVGR